MREQKTGMENTAKNDEYRENMNSEYIDLKKGKITLYRP